MARKTGKIQLGGEFEEKGRLRFSNFSVSSCLIFKENKRGWLSMSFPFYAFFGQ